MILGQKENVVLDFFFHFRNLDSIFEHFQAKHELHS